MIRPQLILDLNSELIVDNFAGGGGASTGIEMALGRHVDIAINHNPMALAMHRANHPQTTHLCEDVYAIDPVKVTHGRPVGYGHFSPDCTHHSKARGKKKPKNKRIRGLAWVMIRWAWATKMRVISMENVEEWIDWGPLLPDDIPNPEHVGRTAQACIDILKGGIPANHPDMAEIREAIPDVPMEVLTNGLGYDVDFKVLRASSQGAPTIRKRFFLIARRDGKPIVWPEATHGKPGNRGESGQRIKPWHPAAECIDFSIPCHSIFMSKEDARKLRIKRPLVKASEARIAKGIDRHVMRSGNPFLISLTHQGGNRIESISEPFRTITAARRGEKAFVSPLIAYQQQGGGVRPVSDPLHTITASNKDQNQVIAVHLARQFGTSIGHAIGEPMKTITASGGGAKNIVIASYLARDFGQSKGQPVGMPAPTVMPGGLGKTKLVSAFIAQNNTGVVGRGISEPLSTIMERGTQQALVAVSLVKYYGTDQDPRVNEPLATITTKDRFGLSIAELGIPPLTPDLAEKARRVAAFLRNYGIQFEGEFATCCGFVIYDIGMRLLTPRELYRAQGFPSGYIIDRGINADGTPIFFSKTAQVHMCGNSVPPPLMAAIARANVPEMAAWFKNEKETAA